MEAVGVTELVEDQIIIVAALEQALLLVERPGGVVTNEDADPLILTILRRVVEETRAVRLVFGQNQPEGRLVDIAGFDIIDAE